MNRLTVIHSKFIASAVIGGFTLAVEAATNDLSTSSRQMPLRPAALPAGKDAAGPDPRLGRLAEALQRWRARHRAGRPATPEQAVKLTAQGARLAQLAGDGIGGFAVRFRRPNGTPLQIKGRPLERRGLNMLQSVIDRDEQTARQFLRANRALLLLEDPDVELVLQFKERDSLGRKHLHFSQRFGPLPVWPCALTVHLDSDGDVDLVDGAYIPTPSGLGLQPQLTPEQALRAAAGGWPAGVQAQAAQPELVVYGPLDGPARLAWKFDIEVGLGRAWRFVVDALDGRVLLQTSLVPHAAEAGSGLDALGERRALGLWREGGTYYMVDTTKGMFDATSTPPDVRQTRGAIVIMDAQNSRIDTDAIDFDQIVHVTSTSASSTWLPDAVSAAFGLAETYDYYFERHNRISFDGRGGSMVGIVRLGRNYQNAFWNGASRVMAFGDGFSKALDVAGHELTHGVIDSVGAHGILEYHDQPGALNEALADIFGEMVEARSAGGPDWLKGKQLGLPEGPIQNYANPGAIEWESGRGYPARLGEFVLMANTADGDNGGVHINSSIVNHAFYLLAQGLPEPLGLGAPEKIFYRTMTLHLQAQSQFIDMRHGCIASAEELYGPDSTQARKTAEAFDRVEILDAPATPPPAPVPVVPGPDSTLALRYVPQEDVWRLIRVESGLHDPPAGTLVDSVGPVAPRRVSVSGDGSFAIYVTHSHDLGFVDTDGASAELGNLPGTVHSVAMSPDGDRYAFVLLDGFGEPSNEINLIELSTQRLRTIPLYVPGTDGARLDIVQYADVMEFVANGRRLIFDAYSEIAAEQDGAFGAWTLFSLDLETETITLQMALDEGLDFGNPSLGNTHAHFLSYETIDKATDLSTILLGNLITGETAIIGRLSRPGALGVPTFWGDDSAIIYAEPDSTTDTRSSLVRQPLVAEGIQPSGGRELWVTNAAYGVVYRRGTFVASNVPPQAVLVSPGSGQSFAAPALVRLAATATDSDGAIALVEFYAGSTKLGEAFVPPYVFLWGGVPAGQYRLTARAFDNLNSSTDSPVVQIQVSGAVLPPAVVAMGSVFGAPGGRVAVPIALETGGGVNAFSFSLSFAPNQASFAGAVLAEGMAGGTLILNSNGAAQGKVGLVAFLPADQTVPAGQQPIVTLSLDLAGDLSGDTVVPVRFASSPASQSVSDRLGQELPVQFSDGSITVVTGYEGDVAPRPEGDNLVSAPDMTMLGRLVAGLESGLSPVEFQRADCAPRSSLGNAAIAVADLTQVARYVAGLDPPTPAGGPARPAASLLRSWGDRPESRLGTMAGARQIVASDGLVQEDGAVTVRVLLHAQGDENALSFSLAYDPSVLGVSGVGLGNGIAQANLFVNTNQAGAVGVVLALPVSELFPAGTIELVQIGFVARGKFAVTPLRFASSPAPNSVSDLFGNDLGCDYVGGTIASLAGFEPIRLFMVGVKPGTVHLKVVGQAGALVNIEATGDFGRWTLAGSVALLADGTGDFEHVVAVGTRQRFYRAFFEPTQIPKP